MANLTEITKPFIDAVNAVSFFDDFLLDQSDINYIDTASDSGTVAAGDSVNGVVVLTPSDGTVADNDEAYIEFPNETLKYGTNRAFYLRAKLSATINTVSAINFAFGATDAPAADTIADNGAGVKTTGSTLVIEKRDGESAFRCTSACNGTATSTLSGTSVVSATDYVLEIMCNDWDSVSMQCSFKVNGQYLKDTNGNQIRHTVAIASATEMAMFAGIKLGASTNLDLLNVDYWGFSQTRV